MKDAKVFTQIVIVSIAVIALSLLYFFYQPAVDSFHPKCIFHALTGLHCPGCGSQRAFYALLHGNVLQAIDFNVLMVAALPFILYSAFVFIWNSFSNQKIQQRIFYNPAFVKIVLALVLLFAVLRNVPYAPFNCLAP